MNAEHPPLGSLQAWMQKALIFPRQVSGEETGLHVEASARLNPAQRLGIYQRSYYLRLLKCMQEQFPALCHALGAELFTDFAREYLQACPPESYTLYDLGRRFPDYLETNRPDRHEPTRETWIDFMVDLAHYERQLFVLFDAPGHEGKPYADESTPDHLLRLQPCFALGDYRFPVAWYYHQVRDAKAPQLPPHEQSFAAMVRKDYLTQTVPLLPHHYKFLSTLARSRNVDWALIPNVIRQRWLEAGFFIEDETASES